MESLWQSKTSDPPVVGVAVLFGVVAPGSKPLGIESVDLHEQLQGGGGRGGGGEEEEYW